jgi:hypothetical protein
MTEIQDGEATAAYDWTRENVIKLATELLSLHDGGHLQFKTLVLDCLLSKDVSQKKLTTTQQRFSRWVNHAAEGETWKNLKEREFRLILAYLYDRSTNTNAAPRAEIMPDGMFHGMIGWLGSENFNLRELRTNFPGEYTVYRHSLMQPGHVAVGRLTIEYVKATGAVSTKEEYRIDKTDDTDETNFAMTGYIFRKNGKYRIFSKHTGTTEVQTMYINAVISRGGTQNGMQIVRMAGVVSDIQGNTYYSTRFACVRNPPEKLQVIPLSEVPKSIRAEISIKPKLDDDGYVVTF